MNVTQHSLDLYKKFLLNRSSTTSHITETIEYLLTGEDDAVSYCFHKIMIHHWNEQLDNLFDMISDFFSVSFVPVSVSKQGDIISFYTNSLSLILKIIRLDFMVPLQRNMHNIDILFNDKSSEELFYSHLTLDDVVSGVVSRRFSDKGELDLSNFCKDEEFIYKHVHFYKINLLANFKLLMLRVGRDTKSLNLSYNKLVLPPRDIMNFFIKGDLVEVNLSHNSISLISDLVRVSSKIEKLWLEGNPLCEDSEPSMYVKNVLIKFPRLVELDGIKISDGVHNRNYTSDTSRSTKMIVNTFLTLYFTHYDSAPRKNYIEGFYDDYSTLSIAHSFGWKEISKYKLDRYLSYGRNLMNNNVDNTSRIYKKQQLIAVLNLLPETIHDPSTFTVDVIRNEKNIMVVVDGIFKENNVEHKPQMFNFRRTFYLSQYKVADNTVYHIQNELFHISLPTKEQIDNSFKHPIRDMNSLSLINPDQEECETIIKILCHITQLKKDEAEMRLRKNRWDIRQALQNIVQDITNNKISLDIFMEEDDFSDSSSLIDDEMVD